METREIGGVPEAEIDMADITLAKDAADALEKHYPGWAWFVNVDSRPTVGIVTIKNGVISAALLRDYGFIYPITDINWNAKVLAKKIMLAGGEFLERSGMKRGPYKGEPITHVEGVKDSHQPISTTKEPSSLVRQFQVPDDDEPIIL